MLLPTLWTMQVVKVDRENVDRLRTRRSVREHCGAGTNELEMMRGEKEMGGAAEDGGEQTVEGSREGRRRRRMVRRG